VKRAYNQKIEDSALLEKLINLRISRGFLRDGGSILGRITSNTY
jgi:hypothetical protein